MKEYIRVGKRLIKRSTILRLKQVRNTLYVYTTDDAQLEEHFDSEELATKELANIETELAGQNETI